jgi:hypothetical protein
MVDVVSVDVMSNIISTKLQLCALCAHEPAKLNIRDLMRNERAKGVDEDLIVYRAMLAQLLIEHSKYVQIHNFNDSTTKHQGGD